MADINSPETLLAALKRREASCLADLEDATSAAGRSAAEVDTVTAMLDTVDLTLDPAATAPLSKADADRVRSLLGPAQSAHRANVLRKEAAEQMATACRNAITIAERHIQLQGQGAAGAFYQHADGAPAATQPCPDSGPPEARPAADEPAKTQTYFRVQDGERDTADLLDPGYQYSHALNGAQHLTRVGVSTCTSLDELALYLVSHIGAGIAAQMHDGWVIVELEGEELPGAVDPEFEQLIRPTRIVSVTPVGDDFRALMAEQDAFLASFVPGPDFDDEE